MHPEVRCLLEYADRLAAGNFIVFANSDIILTGAHQAVEEASKLVGENFLLVGERIDSDLEYFCSECSKNLMLSMHRVVGNFHNSYGIDYFIYKKRTLPLQNMPAFLLGVWRWDNWLLDQVITLGTHQVIDCTSQIQAVHFTKSARHDVRTGSQHNLALYEAFYHGKSFRGSYPVRNGQINCAKMELLSSGALLIREGCK
eukprot:jgi/Picre1/33429/NNA_008753.t1